MGLPSQPEQRLVVMPDPGVDGHDGSWLPPSQLLITKDSQTRSIWPVHLAGWQALGWQVLTPAIPAEGEAGESEVGPGEPEPKPEPGEPDAEPGLGEATDPGPLPTGPEEPGPEPPAPADLQPAAPQPAELEGQGSDEEQQLATSDIAAMTKAEIIQHCSSHYGVLLDSGLTKSALVAEAETLAVPRLPDSLMDDLMT